MEKVTLYCPESEKMYEVMMSSDDARRAASDITFATSLLNAAILEHNKENETQNTVNEISTAADNDLSTEGCEEGSLYRWTDACVLLLLRTYQEIENKFSDGKISHKKCWEQVATLLKEKGYNITGLQCASKLRSLKKTYKSIKDHNAKSGNDRRTWQHFEIMEEIFAKRAWCKLVALASSSGLSVKNTSSTSSCTIDNSCDDFENVITPAKSTTKITRTSMAKLLEKRLSQKDIHEQRKQKRHEDRMAMEEKLIDSLAKFLKK